MLKRTSIRMSEARRDLKSIRAAPLPRAAQLLPPRSPAMKPPRVTISAPDYADSFDFEEDAALGANPEPPRRDPAGMPRRRSVVDTLMRSLSKKMAAVATPYPTRRLGGESAEESDEETLPVVDDSGEHTGDRFRVEQRCDLVSKRCSTVLVKPRSRLFSAIAAFPLFRLLYFMMVALPYLGACLVRGVFRVIMLWVRLSFYMLMVYSVASAAMVALRASNTLQLADVEGRYQFIMGCIAVSALTIAWAPMYAVLYAAWAIGVVLGHQMGEPPVLVG